MTLKDQRTQKLALVSKHLPGFDVRKGEQPDRVRDRLRRKHLMVEVKESVKGGKMMESQTIVLSSNRTRVHELLHGFSIDFYLCAVS